MRRALTLGAAVAALLFLSAGAAIAHPLGNFTVNRYAGITVQPRQILVRYVVDMAEIPTFQERASIDVDGDGRLEPNEVEGYAADLCGGIARGIELTAGDSRLSVRPGARTITFPQGAAGLGTTRVSCELSAELANGSGRIRFVDSNFAGRIGWREITAVGDGATFESSTVPRASISRQLTRYPEDLLSSPLDVRSATIRFRAGGSRASSAGSVGSALLPRGVDRATAAFTSFLGRRSLTLAFAAVAILVSVALGALHALAPGHGKTVMAAYLVGQKGTLKDGAIIAGAVTATHTAGVVVLGVLISVSSTLAPERLYPLLGIASGILLSVIGAGLLRKAVRARQRTHEHGHAAHAHPSSEAVLDRRSLLGVGFAGGLVPSPSALLVLVGAIALGRLWFGVALVIAYGLGMACTLTGAGLLLVKVRGYIERRSSSRRTRPRFAWVMRTVPLITAFTITVVGLTVATRGALRI